MSVVSLAVNYAISRHDEHGCKYDGKSYSHHLRLVLDEFIKFEHLFTEEERPIVESACWLHDTLEDLPISYNDLKSNFGIVIADIVYNVTNELGKNRKERARKTYPKIASCPLSTAVKLFDRLSNVRYSKKNGSSMYAKYQTEHAEFKAALYTPEFKPIWDELESLF